jgi:mannose-6-phosphate isomerase-like protein (cupin superfamily)
MPVYRLQFARKKTDIHGLESCEMFGAGDGHADLGVAWWMLPPGGSSGERSEDRTRALIVLNGRARAVIDGHADDLAAGYAVYIPRGAAWRLENAGREPLVCYAITVPAGTAAGA